jgi:hypothetical protein
MASRRRDLTQKATNTLGYLYGDMRDPYRTSTPIPTLVLKGGQWDDFLSRLALLREEIEMRRSNDAEIKAAVQRLFAEVMDFMRRRIYEGTAGVVEAMERFDDTFFKGLRRRLDLYRPPEDYKGVLLGFTYATRTALGELEPYLEDTDEEDVDIVVDNAGIDQAITNIKKNLDAVFGLLYYDEFQNKRLYASFGYDGLAGVGAVNWLCVSYLQIRDTWRAFADSSLGRPSKRVSTLHQVRDAIQ